jgi:hypothetical protein
MFMSYDDSDNEHWKPVSATAYRLSNMGEWKQPMCAPNDDITEPTDCTDYWERNVGGGGSGSSGEKKGQYSYTSFGDGGKMNAGGVIALILLIVFGVAIAATIYKKKTSGVLNKELTDYQMQSREVAV